MYLRQGARVWDGSKVVRIRAQELDFGNNVMKLRGSIKGGERLAVLWRTYRH